MSVKPETLAWLCQTAKLEGGITAQAILRLLERVGVPEAEAILHLLECLQKLEAAESLRQQDEDAEQVPPIPEAAPVTTDEDLEKLAHCYMVMDGATGSVSLEHLGFGRACINLGRQHGAALAAGPAGEPGEVAELVEFLTPTREQAGAISLDAFLKLRRAATLLQQLSAPAPGADPLSPASDDHQPTQPMSTTPRDPHLSPPAVDVDPEQDLLSRILGECVNTDLSATHAAGVLYAAAALMLSKTYDLSPCEQEGE